MVALQEIGAHGDYAAHCGEVMATAFTRLGAVGLVWDIREPTEKALNSKVLEQPNQTSDANTPQVEAGTPAFSPGGATAGSQG